MFGVNPDTVFNVKGIVVHEDDMNGGYGSDIVRRSLYIDNTLYTISWNKIVMSDLNDLKTPIGEIQLQDPVVLYYE